MLAAQLRLLRKDGVRVMASQGRTALPVRQLEKAGRDAGLLPGTQSADRSPDAPRQDLRGAEGKQRAAVHDDIAGVVHRRVQHLTALQACHARQGAEHAAARWNQAD